MDTPIHGPRFAYSLQRVAPEGSRERRVSLVERRAVPSFHGVMRSLACLGRLFLPPLARAAWLSLDKFYRQQVGRLPEACWAPTRFAGARTDWTGASPSPPRRHRGACWDQWSSLQPCQQRPRPGGRLGTCIILIRQRLRAQQGPRSSRRALSTRLATPTLRARQQTAAEKTVVVRR